MSNLDAWGANWPDKIVLASRSPYRAALLDQIGLSFTVQPAHINEELPHPGIPPEAAEELARLKALEIAHEYSIGTVLGADTVVSLDGRIMGKPQDSDDALAMLTTLSGRTHIVSSGMAAVDARTGRCLSLVESTEVTMHSLSETTLKAYLATGEGMDKAGGYGIQGVGGMLVRRISGCYFTVVGLPLSRLSEVIQVAA